MADTTPIAADPPLHENPETPIMAENTPTPPIPNASTPTAPVVAGGTVAASTPPQVPNQPHMAAAPVAGDVTPEPIIRSAPHGEFDWAGLTTRTVAGPRGTHHGVKVRKNDNGTLTVKPWSYEGPKNEAGSDEVEVPSGNESDIPTALGLTH